MFRSVADCKNVTLEFTPERDLFIMDYDPEKLAQIVSNIVSNALKFIQKGGRIDVVAEIRGKSGQNFIIRIRDNGPGIQSDHLPHIFDRFYHAPESKEQPNVGSGLGLALTRELVKLTGGNIGAESKYGEGTEFTVSLPVTHNAPVKDIAELKKADCEISKEIDTHEVRINGTMPKKVVNKDKPLLLIVEDNQEVADYLVTLLESQYNIQTAVNGKVGLQKALKLIPDIILTDIMMPVMDGIELLDRVKNDSLTSHIPVVILTAKADIAARLDGLERGADAYIAKPFNKRELMVQLNKLIKLRKKLQDRYSGTGPLSTTEENDYGLEDKFINQVRDIMIENLANEKFDINELCKIIAMSRSQLYRKFKSLTDRTLNEYLLFLRLSKARELLTASDINVSEAAFRTGFKNLSHFSRVFTREFGVNPSEL